MTKTIIYDGWIREARHKDYSHALYLDTRGNEFPDEPLASIIERHMWVEGDYLTVRYFVINTERRVTVEEAGVALLKRLDGEGDALYIDHYSELTGYLWTDEELRVGGHDLLQELRSNLGKYVLLEITYNQEPEL